MKNKWSKHWNKSVQPRKQRKFRYNAPLHVARDFMAAPLSKDLRKKYEKRALIVRKGDKVKVLRGSYKGKIGNVEDVQIKFQKIAVEGVSVTGKDGKKRYYLLHPSKVLILELNLEDKKRKASLERKQEVKQPQEKKTATAPKAAAKKVKEK